MAVETRFQSSVEPMKIYENDRVRGQKELLNRREMVPVPKISHADFGGGIQTSDWLGGRKG